MRPSMAISNHRFLNRSISGDMLEISHESILKCLLPYLVAGALLSVGNVEWVDATNTHE